jgi:hypothetical protein
MYAEINYNPSEYLLVARDSSQRRVQLPHNGEVVRLEEVLGRAPTIVTLGVLDSASPLDEFIDGAMLLVGQAQLGEVDIDRHAAGKVYVENVVMVLDLTRLGSADFDCHFIFLP